jgi:hypothetical protein
VRTQVDEGVANRAFCNAVGLPSTVRLKCQVCGARASQPGVRLHAVRVIIGKECWYSGFLCCRHRRSFTGETCCPDAP